MKNHVFLFQVHKDPSLVARILKRMEGSNHFFIINVDRKCKVADQFREALSGIGNVIFNEAVNVQHGGFSQIKCTLLQLKLAMTHNVRFDYFHTMSGQDYPCVTMEDFDTFFENNTASYMMLDTEEEAAEWSKAKYPNRMEHWNLADVFNQPWMNKLHLAGVTCRLLHWIPRKCKFMKNIRGGWNWFSLHRVVVDYLLKYCLENPQYVNRFKFTSCGDELFFPTILNDRVDELSIVRRNSLRYVDWYPKRAYNRSLPLILNEQDYELIMNSGAFFCRKVDCGESRLLLEMIDQQVFGITGS